MQLVALFESEAHNIKKWYVTCTVSSISLLQQHPTTTTTTTTTTCTTNKILNPLYKLFLNNFN